MNFVVYPLVFGVIAYAVSTALRLPARWPGTIIAAVVGVLIAFIR